MTGAAEGVNGWHEEPARHARRRNAQHRDAGQTSWPYAAYPVHVCNACLKY